MILFYKHKLDRFVDQKDILKKALKIFENGKQIYSLLCMNGQNIQEFYNMLDINRDYKLMRKLVMNQDVVICQSQKKQLQQKLKQRYFRFIYKSSGIFKFELFISNDLQDLIIGIKALQDYIIYYRKNGNIQRCKQIQIELDSILFRNQHQKLIAENFQIKQKKFIKNPLLNNNCFNTSSHIIGLPFKGNKGFINCSGLKIDKDNIILINHKNFQYYIDILYQQQVVSIDTEFVNFPYEMSQNSKLCLIQIGFDKSVLLFDILNIQQNQFDLLIELLENPNILKLGFQFKSDIKILDQQTDKDVKCKNFVFMEDLSENCKNLKDFVYEFLEYDFCKFDQVSQWDRRPLSMQLIHYAAMDVIVLQQIFELLTKKINQKFQILVHNKLHQFKKQLQLLKIEFKNYRKKKFAKKTFVNKIIFLKESIWFKQQNIFQIFEPVKKTEQIQACNLLNILIKL